MRKTGEGRSSACLDGWDLSKQMVAFTSKAQQSPAYLDYLSRSGEDNQLYYDVKISATRLLLENTANTFVTPVFNGSTSLRDAAGQMIENVTKSSVRKQTVDAQYMENLYTDVIALYRLDQIEGASGKVNLGPLPQTASTLLWTLGITWVLILLYVTKEAIKQKKSKQKY